MMHKAGLFLGLLLTLLATACAAPTDQKATQPEAVASITRLVGEASVGHHRLSQGDTVSMGDTISTLDHARVELRFIDGMDITLGENAQLQIDTLIFDPTDHSGSAVLAVPVGAFRVKTGKIAKTPDAFSLTTPYVSIGVRGTDFWGGPLDDPFAVLTLDGIVTVATPQGQVILTKGQGTEIKQGQLVPMPPHPWGAKKIQRALDTVSFP